jgi:ADP-sugar diphosphatase
MNAIINGNSVPVSGENAELAVNSFQFKDWANGVDPRFNIRSIEFQSVDIGNHGRQPKVRFIKFKADVVDADGKPFAGIVFMRGGSVAILVILECEGEEYTILTIQPRFPGGNFAFPEIPAGTLEDDGSFAGGAARELEEETGIKIKKEDLVDLTALIYGDKFKGVFPTVGGSDEFFRLFAFRMEVKRDYLENLQGKCMGLACENEQITLKVIKLDDLAMEAPDAKALSALMLYVMAQARKKV